MSVLSRGRRGPKPQSFACPTFEEAIESFRARKEKQLRVLNAQIEHVNEALSLTPVDPPVNAFY